MRFLFYLRCVHSSSVGYLALLPILLRFVSIIDITTPEERVAMGEYGDQYVVGKEYRNAREASKNEYYGWLNGPLNGGVNSGMGIHRLQNPRTGDCEFLVFYSSDGPSESRDPWEDVINLDDGVVRYWGGSKAGSGPDPLAGLGNSWVKTQYCETYAKNNRSAAPPVLLFRKDRSGYVTFCGLCIMTGLSVERHRDDGEIVVNYLIDMKILDTDTVELEWIHRKARTGYDVGGPKAWNHWVDTGTIRQYSIYNQEIRTTSEQYPDGRYERLHSDIRTRLDGPKRKRGEKLELLLEKALNSLENFRQVERTASSGDKGVDLTGRINLFSDIQLTGPDTEIDFKAQVKNKQGSINGRELSRLASRIDDGEIGLFFTMSHYTQASQHERHTTYPLRLFSGRDIVELLVQTDLTDGNRLTDSLVSDINESV